MKMMKTMKMISQCALTCKGQLAGDVDTLHDHSPPESGDLISPRVAIIWIYCQKLTFLAKIDFFSKLAKLDFFSKVESTCTFLCSG